MNRERAAQRFEYYQRLSAAQQAAYRRSDAVGTVDLPLAEPLQALLAPLDQALLANDQRAVARASRLFTATLVSQLQAPPVKVRVLAVRPVDDGTELHGLYEPAEEDSPAVLRAWMRTAAQRKPVAFRSFVRTLLHEVVHHLDMTVMNLEPSFHTQGFFRREAHLARQLLGPRAAPAPPAQMDLFER